MSLKRKQMLLQQKEYFEKSLQNRLSILSGKGIETRKADKDTLVRKWKARIKAMNSRLKLIADDAKITEDMKKTRTDKAAAALKDKEDKESGKAEKPKKAPEAPKEKKAKPEKKAAPPKAPEGKTPEGGKTE